MELCSHYRTICAGFDRIANVSRQYMSVVLWRLVVLHSALAGLARQSKTMRQVQYGGCNLTGTRFCIVSLNEACHTTSPFLSNVKGNFGVPTSRFIWLFNASLLCAKIKSAVIARSTSSAFAVFIGWVSKLALLSSLS